jgi:uncharacterized metal-binding protein YceD (DUF177 family)
MTNRRPEFSRVVPLTRLGADPFRQEVAATEAERAALVRRFELVSLDRFTAKIELLRESGGTILLRAEFEAAFSQTCIVTLDSVPGTVQESFALRYGPPESDPGDAVLDDDQPAFEPLIGEAIDIGEAVAQEFSLALPPFPRAEGAVVEDEAGPKAEEGPFAALARLTGRGPQ